MRTVGYYIIACTFAGFIYCLVRTVNFRPFFRGGWRKHWVGILAVLLCGTFLQMHEPHRMKIEYDESVLSVTSMLMHKERRVGIPDTTHYYNGRLNYNNVFVDKRPILFPFLTSIVHDLTGMRMENSFVTNAFAGFLLLGSVYGWVARVQGPRYGVLAIILLTGLPLLAQNATGGGMDLLNIAVIVFVMHLGLYFLKNPDKRTMNLFILGMLLMAQARYESILFLIPCALLIALIWWQDRKIWMSWFAVFSPLLLISPLLSARIYTTNEDFFQLDSKEGASAFFSLEHIAHNLPRAIYYFFRIDRDQTNSVLLSVFGFICIAFSIMLIRTYWKKLVTQPDWYSVFYGFFVVVGFNTVWALTNFWGQFDDPVVSRITLPIHVMMGLCIALVAKEFFKTRPLPNWIPGVATAWLIFWTFPSTATAYLTDDLDTSRTTTWAREWMRENTDMKDLMIGYSSIPWVIGGRAGITAIRAAAHPEEVIRARDLGFYDNIYFVCRMWLQPDMTFKPYESADMFEHFEMETVEAIKYRPHIEARIFRIKSLKPNTEAAKRLDELRSQTIPEDVDIRVEGAIFLLKQLP